MVKIVVQFEFPDHVFNLLFGLYPENTKEKIEKFVKDHNSWGISAKILEMPEKDVKNVQY